MKIKREGAKSARKDAKSLVFIFRAFAIGLRAFAPVFSPRELVEGR